MIKDMKSRTIVGNCHSEKFFGVDVYLGSVLEKDSRKVVCMLLNQ